MAEVAGLEKFKEYFGEYSDNYIIVGGTACSVVMGDAGLDFRATRDIDMILIIEDMTHEFGQAFWRFVNDGGYTVFENKSGEPQFFRFMSPKTQGYPAMIELFSRKQDIFKGQRHGTFIPVAIGDEISSLSAILLDDDYYAFLKSGRQIVDGLSVLSPMHLIAFKAKAYIDLMGRKANGAHVNSGDIKKHKNDVFRLTQLLSTDMSVNAPQTVKDDLNAFFERIDGEDISMGALDVPLSRQEATQLIKDIFGI